MDTKLLKQKILDLAIHGKLVPQNSTDEPASVLLEKVREERARLISEKKIKPDKNESYIFQADDGKYYEKFADGREKNIEDEIPFELPKGWSWCRLPEISKTIIAGGDKPSICEKEKSEKCFVPIFSNGIENDGLYGFTDKPTINKPSITISARGTIGFSSIRLIPFVPIVRLITVIPLLNLVDLIFLKSCFDSLLIFSTGSSIPQLTIPKVKQFLIPLPPLAEQKRIVEKLEEIFSYINTIENEKVDFENLIKQAKSKILDLAIHGKLVPQDSADEPASKLLEKVRAERQAKIEAGEIKRDKNESYIYKNASDNCYYEKFADGREKNIEEEIPFELPNGWSWCRLGDICLLQDGEKKDGEFPYLDAKHFRGKETDIANSGKYVSANNYVILVDGENSGEVFYTEIEGYQGSTFKILNISRFVDDKYILFLIRKEHDLLKKTKVGSAIPHLNKKLFRELFVALPPLTEQKRIVEKIEEIFSYLDKIALNLV